MCRVMRPYGSHTHHKKPWKTVGRMSILARATWFLDCLVAPWQATWFMSAVHAYGGICLHIYVLNFSTGLQPKTGVLSCGISRGHTVRGMHAGHRYGSLVPCMSHRRKLASSCVPAQCLGHAANTVPTNTCIWGQYLHLP